MPRNTVLAAPMLAIAGIGAALAGGPYDGTYHGTLIGEGMNAMRRSRRSWLPTARSVAPLRTCTPVEAEGRR
jgi:hypothetical protein